MEVAAVVYALPEGRRSFVFLGEAGCGKSELAVNLALRLAAGDALVHLFDLDMTKPLFRSRDLGDTLAGAGVTLHYEEQFMDDPTVSGGVMRLLRDEKAYTVLDVAAKPSEGLLKKLDALETVYRVRLLMP